ncbi:hypothetical protein OE749_09915 [Aestuariibacter sp. AA17]|uniref:CheR-type methyltransferase domain-containing protein n=1 Tax=Fluctibacter corallii TaxID=2984329 RepID=A0ABT3A8K7_9ALTE|nr:CheR family methyltransferase [Aestuariibacter sp. AA17]MCV2885012.1 hypothetical protein [Aestuariibacter sp. AA17]
MSTENNAFLIALREAFEQKCDIDTSHISDVYFAYQIQNFSLRFPHYSLNDILLLLEGQDARTQLLIDSLLITTTTMFREPETFRELRRVAPECIGKSTAQKVAFLGCSSGEEVLSFMILMREVARHISFSAVAIDISEHAILQAKSSLYPLHNVAEYAKNYQRAGGADVFHQYYRKHQDLVAFKPALTAPVTFQVGNCFTLLPQRRFCLIFCRHLMIYFSLRDMKRIQAMLIERLEPGGILVMGQSESLLLEFENKLQKVAEGMYLKAA